MQKYNLKKYIKNPITILTRLMILFPRLVKSDKLYLQLKYYTFFHKWLDFNNPKTFNEKLQWLKLYDRKPIYTTLVDKFEVKDYVKGIIGEEYIIPTIAVWDRVEDINFEDMSDQFVLKCTHDSGSVCVCKDKYIFNVEDAKKKLQKGLKNNLYYKTREWPYKGVMPRIIAEEYLVDRNSNEPQNLRDYKFMCFNGKVECSFVCTDRFNDKGLKVTFFDREWNRLPFCRQYPAADYEIAKPKTYSKMVELAEILSKNVTFVRVDFYEVNGHIYFGEMTFFPGSGMEKFEPKEWDRKLGDMIKLPEI